MQLDSANSLDWVGGLRSRERSCPTKIVVPLACQPMVSDSQSATLPAAQPPRSEPMTATYGLPSRLGMCASLSSDLPQDLSLILLTPKIKRAG
jgi:hypothetical protein